MAADPLVPCRRERPCSSTARRPVTAGAPANPRQPAGHPAGPAPTERGELAELSRLLLRTVLPATLGIGLVLAAYGGTGHDPDIILQDRFPDVSEYSGLLTIVFGTAVLVCAGMALGSVVVSRAWFGTAANGASAPRRCARA